MRDAPEASSEGVRRSMRANRGRDTAPELALRRELHGRGLRYRLHRRPVRGLRCTPDIVFVGPRVAVFVDGCFWHRCPIHGTDPKAHGDWWARKLDENVARDRRNDRALTEHGWTVIRVWEHETPTAAADHIAEALEAAL